ncbi:MAG: acyl-CoA thioesterase [Oscillospiraceae bacterium]|jgi:acyl-CoA hydrolase
MESAKRVKDSYTEQIHIIKMSSLNGAKRLFGGQLMQWIDEVAAVTARRHSGKNVTTALIDTLHFRQPAYANNTIVLSSKLVHVGNSSMEIRVTTYVERLDGEKICINDANIVMVAMDESERPVRVPRLLLETDEERYEWQCAEERIQRRRMK